PSSVHSGVAAASGVAVGQVLEAAGAAASDEAEDVEVAGDEESESELQAPVSRTSETEAARNMVRV
ncbi:MAG: hypothetical protein WBG53_25085, partial [Rhodococcus sp. (in: high G+C Gram-positive bacteria)]